MFHTNGPIDERDSARQAAVELELLAQLYIIHGDLDKAAEVIHIAEQIMARINRTQAPREGAVLVDMAQWQSDHESQERRNERG